jgi:hypothetical protein
MWRELLLSNTRKSIGSLICLGENVAKGFSEWNHRMARTAPLIAGAHKNAVAPLFYFRFGPRLRAGQTPLW